MSAFMVSDKHISAMLAAAAAPRYTNGPCGEFMYFYGGEWKRHQLPKALGQILASQNRRSVNERYEENDAIPEFSYQPPRESPSPVQLIKLCDCYDYQSCETDDWEKTEAYAICHALRERAIDRLPGYDEAAWSYEEGVTA